MCEHDRNWHQEILQTSQASQSEKSLNILRLLMLFSWRFMKWNGIIILTFFNPRELIKIVLQIFKGPNGTIWHMELNYNSCSFFQRNIQSQTRLKGPPFNFFRTETFLNFFPCLQRVPAPWFFCFATEWMLKNPKYSLSIFGTMRPFKIRLVLQLLEITSRNSGPIDSMFTVDMPECAVWKSFVKKLFQSCDYRNIEGSVDDFFRMQPF